MYDCGLSEVSKYIKTTFSVEFDEAEILNGGKRLEQKELVIINEPSSTTEIPDWIQNNAGWWSDSLITDEDFIEAMQWLVAEGVIQI